jgi:hypothetical protein
MSKKIKQRTFDEALSELRTHKFDVAAVPGVANQVRIEKYGCAAVLAPGSLGTVAAFLAKPGFVVGGEIARLVDRGYQKFLKSERLEIPATADALRAIHRFNEELTEALGSDSLYNEALGTVSDRYLYDRVKGRDLPESSRPAPAWKLPIPPQK